MIYFILKTGARFGELRALKWQDINWETGILSIKRSVFRGIMGIPKNNQYSDFTLFSSVIDGYDNELFANTKQKQAHTDLSLN